MSTPKTDKINVIVAIDFSDDILDKLREISPRLHIERHYPDVPDSVWSTAEVLYTLRHFPEPETAPLLRWIQLHYAGVERALAKRIIQVQDVEVTSASGIHAKQIANYCLMMILAFHYQLPSLMRLQSRAEWPANAYDLFRPQELSQQILGIVGYGSIGRELARVAQQVGMRVLASKRDVKHPAESGAWTESGSGDPHGEIPERIYPGDALVSMAKECDYLVITAPLTPKTHHMVNETVLNALKPNAVLINVARGPIVDEAALISALAAERIRGAALDVFEEEPLPKTSPLWNLDNVIITPHISGNSAQYHEKAAALFAENLKRYLDNKPLLNKLNREVGY